MPAPAVAVKTRMQPLNVNTTRGGEIVRYVPPPSTTTTPQVITPVPRGTYSNPSPTPISSSVKPDIIDAQVVPTPKTAPSSPQARRPVVGSDAMPSSQSKSPGYYPQYPDPSAGWKTLADFAAWQNGESKEIIDAERAAYEFTSDWGKAGGVLYPWTSQGPRTPIVSENYDLANKYRARNGLPAIDRFGNEQAAPLNPSVQPGAGFSSNPFKTALDNLAGEPATPANFPDRRQSSDIDPDTGLPYTPLQQQRGKELGRPAWHINPTTGNPWGSEEPGVPIPLPFNGAPGGAVKFPAPEPNPVVLETGVWTVNSKVIYSNGQESPNFIYTVAGRASDVWSVRDNGTGQDVMRNGTVFDANYTLNRNGGSLRLGPTFQPDIGTNPTPGADPNFTPFGTPAPSLPRTAPDRVSPDSSPAPGFDPRLNPTIPTPQPVNPGGRPIDSPYTPAPLPNPAPSPRGNPLPSIPSLPSYSPNPQPYPRVEPNGNPSPSPDPQARPEPARPSNPSATETYDRPTPSPVNPAPGSAPTVRCPDPCSPEEMATIEYKKFKGCLVLPSGAPDRFEGASLSVPKNAAPAIKSMLDSLAEIQARECVPCCYWDISKGVSQVLWTGLPAVIGQEIAIAKGIARVNVSFNAASAISDNSLRNLKRIALDSNPAHVFVNTAVVYLVNDKGATILSEQLWNVNTEVAIPFEYRDREMKLRLLPKGSVVNFTVLDSGDRWVQVNE